MILPAAIITVECALIISLALGQTAPALRTDATAPDIPGVVAGGTRVQLIAQDLRGTEGPIAAPDGTLLLTERQADVVSRIDSNDRRSTYLENTGGASGLTFDRTGRLLATSPSKQVVLVLSPVRSTLAATFGGKPLLRPNDLVADRNGGVYFTDPGPNLPSGAARPGPPSVRYIRSDGTVVTIAEGIERPNGIALSPDETVLYVANTLGPAVVAFDVQSGGAVSNRRDFAQLDGVTKTATGVRSGADGMAIDSTGRLYVATQVGVQVFTSGGRHLGTIPIGAPNGPQNLAFAGPEKRTLYIVGGGAVWKVLMLAQGPRTRAK